MTKTRIVALLSVLALLASLPLSVALAQGQPPFRVVGTAELDGVMAAEGTNGRGHDRRRKGRLRHGRRHGHVRG